MLLSQDVQLAELVLTTWMFSEKRKHRKRLLYTLNKFINSQRSLKVLSVQNAWFNVAEGVKLLGACASELEQLNLFGAFRDWQVAYTNTKYLEVFECLKCLTTLYVDYSAISDTVIYELSAQRVLKHLHVAICDTEYRQHAISDAAWSCLALCCPHLRVSITVGKTIYK